MKKINILVLGIFVIGTILSTNAEITISLMTLDNVQTYSHSLNFHYNVTGNYTTYDCILWEGGQNHGTNSSTLNATETVILTDPPIAQHGIYLWNVSCTAGSESAVSETRIFVLLPADGADEMNSATLDAMGAGFNAMESLISAIGSLATLVFFAWLFNKIPKYIREYKNQIK